MSIAQKVPLARTLSVFAENTAASEIAKLGLAPPGHVVAVSGSIVTVNFDVRGITLPQVTMPLAGSEYIRLPVQVGDKGFAVPCDFFLGGVSGLGSGVADTTQRANLSTLVWLPVGNKNWTASPNPNATVIYGPDGVILQDKAGASPDFRITVNSSGITMTGGGHTVTLNSAGLTIDGVVFSTHGHSAGTYVAGANAVTGDSGGVV